MNDREIKNMAASVKSRLLNKSKAEGLAFNHVLQTCPESFSGLLDELFVFLLPIAKEIETKNSIRGQWTLESGWKTQD